MPATIELCVREANSFTNPKSATFTCSPEISRFAGLISRCCRPCRWAR